MKPEDIEAYIHAGVTKALAEQLPLAVNTAVSASVNGKIDALRKEIAPIIQTYNTWLSYRRAALIFIGLIMAIGGFIQSAQELWSLFTNYVSVSLK